MSIDYKKKIVSFSEQIFTDNNITLKDIKKISGYFNKVDLNLRIYKGIISVFTFSKFNQIPFSEFKYLKQDKIFLKCLDIFNNDLLSPNKTGLLFSKILELNKDTDTQDFLMGCFLGSLWKVVCDEKNHKWCVDTGIEVSTNAFNMDQINTKNKIEKNNKDIKIVSVAGSGKKDIKLLNISTMSAITTVLVGKKYGYKILVSKTISGATSSVSGSADIFEILGANLNLSIKDMNEVMHKTGIGIFNINNVVPKLNKIYDGRLHNVQFFAGLVGGASQVNPIDSDLISYGLTRGSVKLSLDILKKIYPDKNIIITQGKNLRNKSVMDQVSINGSTIFCCNLNNKYIYEELSPEDFGFKRKSFSKILSKKTKDENLIEFVKFLRGQGDMALMEVVAIEVAINLFGINLIKDLKEGSKMALEVIMSGKGIELVNSLIEATGGKSNILLEQS